MKLFYFFLFCFFTGISTVSANYSITKYTNPSFCTTYPSSFTSGNFVLAEASRNGAKGFRKGQSNATLIFGFSNPAFQFNPGVGTVTASGTEVTIVSYTITTTAITVTINTAPNNYELNAISFNNIQIKATSAATGYIKRTGGNFLVDNKSSNPYSAVSLGDLTAGTPFAYSSSNASQPVTSTIFSGSSDNQVIGVQVTIAGTCSSLSATAFNFNTSGSTAASTDIARAKLYYTGTTNSFSTASLFGSTNSPSGAFTINGSQVMNAAGTYYYWLVYDLTSTATSGNSTDAQLVSEIISGNTYAATSGNPAGSRTISTNVFYSIAAGNWSSTSIWSRTSGGSSCSCAPTGGNGFAYVNHAVVLDNSYTIDNVTIQSNGNLSNAASKVLTINNSLATAGTGLFTASTSWLINHLTMTGTGASSASSALLMSGNLNVGTGTSLQLNGGIALTINGNINVDGTIAAGTSIITNSNAAGAVINGSGSITGSGTITLGVNKTIPAGANLSIAPAISIANGIVITNNGTVTMQNNITGGNVNSQWTNAANAVLNMSGTTSALLSTGILDASAVPNSVIYSGSGNQSIKTPLSSYYNLYFSSTASGIKTMAAAITVNNDLQLSGSAQLSTGANNINISGNWTNNSSNANPFSSTGTVNFNGITTISGTGINNFNHLNISSTGLLISGSSGKVTVAGNWINDGDFDANNSDITFNGTTVMSGSSLTDFNNVIVNASKSLTLDPTETNIDGTLTVNGSLLHNSGLLVFTGIGTTQNINGATTALSLYKTEINNTGGIVLSSRPITINNLLTLTAGNLNTGSYDLTFTASAGAVAGSPFSATNMIIASGGGQIIKAGTSAATASFTFPVGDNTGTVEYSPVTITFNSGTYTSGTAGVKVTNTQHPNNTNTTNYLNRYWTITSSGYSVTNAVVNATYNDADIVGSEAGIVMGRWTGATPWDYYASSLNIANNSLVSPAITAFGDFTGISDPVQWTGAISTDWLTAGNWSNNVIPTGTTNVTIPSTAIRMPLVTASVNCNSLVINSSATLTNSATGIINVFGTLANNGSFTDNGTTIFTGSSGQQTFSGVAAFNNLTINNTSGILLPAAITVNNNITISSGTLNTNNFNIDIKGNWYNNASTTALVAGTASVNFTGSGAQSIGGSFTTNFNNLTIANTASTVSLNINVPVSGNLSVSSGTFDIGSYTVNRINAGGILTVANNAILKIGGTNVYPSNYTTNNLVVASTIAYYGANQTIANQVYGNLLLSTTSGAVIKTLPATALTIIGNLASTAASGASVSFTAGANITVNGNISIGTSTSFNSNAYTISTGGNWVNNGTFNGNTGGLILTGSGTSVSGTGTQNFNNLTVAASLINFPGSLITVSGNLATQSSGSFTQSSGGLLSMTGSSKTISGIGISLYNLDVTGTITTTSSLTITGNLSVAGTFTASAGTITMNGSSKTITGNGTIAFSFLSITGAVTTNANFSILSALNINGTFSATAGAATFTGSSSLSGTANLYNVVINGVSLQLASNSVLGIAGGMNIIAGNLNATSTGPNTVAYNGTGAQNVNGITYSNLVLSNGNTKTASGALTTVYDLTIGTATTFDPATYTHNIYGSWNNNGTFIPGNSNIQFSGPATSYINGATTFNILTSNTSNSTTELILNSNISAAIVNMTNGRIITQSDTITITNTRTGNGYIFGNITRTHAFTTGVSYAFEGPDNSINFSAVSGVNSITVNVTKSAVADFPFGSCIRRIYTIGIPTGTYTATLRLHYEDDELNGNDELNMGMWNYDAVNGWIPASKTANDATTNYLEQNGLTSLATRWTISINPSVVLWNGSVSSDWNNAANWTPYVGGGSTPPSSSDVAVLGAIPGGFQPAISTSVVIKNLVFVTPQPTTLSMLTGGSLVSGDVVGVWNANAAHSINVNNQSITINGSIAMSDGSSNNQININIAAGTLDVNGSITQAGNATINFTDTGKLYIHEDYTLTNGTFIAGTGSVTYDGDENQKIAHVNYNNLIIKKPAGLAATDSAINITGNLLIASGQLDNNFTMSVSGDIGIAPGATLHNYHMVHIGGNWNNYGTYVGTGAHVMFNGSGTQTVTATTFNIISINKASGTDVVLTGNLVVNGDIIVTSGRLNIKTYDCNRSLQGGTFQLDDAATLIYGSNNMPLRFSNFVMSNGSTVIADGTVAQSVIAASYGHLVLRNTGLKTLIGSVSVNGNLTIENGAAFNGGSYTITLLGHWLNSGTFTPSTGTVLCTGTNKNISGNTTFNHITVPGSYTILNDVEINGLLNITSTGSLSGGSSIHVLMNGDLINSGTLYTLGTTTFSGNVLQTLSLINAVQTVAVTVNFNGSVSPVLNSTSVPQYGYLNINNTGGVNPSVGWTILYALSIANGASFNGGNSTHNIMGSLINNGTLTSSGTLNFVPSSSATLNFGTGFSSTGTVVLGGSGATTVAGSAATFYDLIISNSNNAGITAPAGWNITNNFTVSNGAKFYAGNYTHTVGGNAINSGTCNSSGTINFIPAADASINLGSNFTSTGTVVFGGTGKMNLAVTAATLNDVTISNTNAAGITSSSGCNHSHNFTVNSGSTLNANNYFYVVSGNLINNGIINCGSSTFNLNGTGLQNIYSVSNLNNLSLNKSSGQVNLLSNLNVNGTVTFNNGIVNTNDTAMLIFGTLATVAGTPGNNSYINGPVAKQLADGDTREFSFPTGNAAETIPFNPCGIVPVDITGGNTIFTAQYFASPLQTSSIMGGAVGLEGVSGTGFWDIANSSATSTARVKLMYTTPASGEWVRYNASSTAPFYDASPDPCGLCNVAVVHRNTTTNTWEFTDEAGMFNSALPEYRYNTDEGYIYSAVLNNFSPFAIGFAYSTILPVKLLAFQGTLINSKPSVSWKVNTAEDVATFDLEASNDGLTFRKIAVIRSNKETNYSYVDTDAFLDSRYYRLHVYEKNGHTFYSSIVLLSPNKNNSKLEIHLLQNPVMQWLTPVIISDKKQQVGAVIFDASGRLLERTNYTLVIGENKWPIAAGSYKPGIYILNVIAEDGRSTAIKFIKN